MNKTEQNKVRVVARSRDGFSAIVQSTAKICRACGEPKTSHEPGCLESEISNFKSEISREVATLAEPATPHVCLAANCGTLIDAEDNFCEYHFQRIPEDLCWLYVKSGPDARKLALQQMVDHFDPARSGDGPSPDLKSQLLRECFEFLNLMGREEIFRCVDCHCDRTIFIDDEQANRFDTLLNRIQDALQ